MGQLTAKLKNDLLCGFKSYTLGAAYCLCIARVNRGGKTFRSHGGKDGTRGLGAYSVNTDKKLKQIQLLLGGKTVKLHYIFSYVQVSVKQNVALKLGGDGGISASAYPQLVRYTAAVNGGKIVGKRNELALYVVKHLLSPSIVVGYKICVAYGDSQSVCRIVGLGHLVKLKQQLGHIHYLPFLSSAVAYQILLYLQRGVFVNINVALLRRQKNGTAALRHVYCRFYVFVKKQLLYCHNVGLMSFKYGKNLVVYLPYAFFKQGVRLGDYRPVLQRTVRVPFGGNNAVTHRCKSRVNA